MEIIYWRDNHCCSTVVGPEGKGVLKNTRKSRNGIVYGRIRVIRGNIHPPTQREVARIIVPGLFVCLFVCLSVRPSACSSVRSFQTVQYHTCVLLTGHGHGRIDEQIDVRALLLYFGGCGGFHYRNPPPLLRQLAPPNSLIRGSAMYG